MNKKIIYITLFLLFNGIIAYAAIGDTSNVGDVYSSSSVGSGSNFQTNNSNIPSENLTKQTNNSTDIPSILLRSHRDIALIEGEREEFYYNNKYYKLTLINLILGDIPKAIIDINGKNYTLVTGEEVYYSPKEYFYFHNVIHSQFGKSVIFKVPSNGSFFSLIEQTGDNTSNLNFNQYKLPKSITLGEGENYTLYLKNRKLNIAFLNATPISAMLSLNGKVMEIKLKEQIFFNNLTIYMFDLLYSDRDSVKTYIELVVSSKPITQNKSCVESKDFVVLSGISEPLYFKDYCSLGTVVDYYCSNETKKYRKIHCDFGCVKDGGGYCEACSIPNNQRYANKFSLGENEKKEIIVNGKKYAIKVNSLSSGYTQDKLGFKSVLLSIGGKDLMFDSCEQYEDDNIILRIDSISTSNRPGVKGYIEASYKIKKKTIDCTQYSQDLCIKNQQYCEPKYETLSSPLGKGANLKYVGCFNK